MDVLCKYTRENRLRLYEGWKLRYIADIFFNIDNDHLFEAEEWIKGAVVADKKNDMKIDLGQNYRLYSDLLKRKGDKLQAREKLLKAIEIFKECGAIPKAQQVEKEYLTSNKGLNHSDLMTIPSVILLSQPIMENDLSPPPASSYRDIEKTTYQDTEPARTRLLAIFHIKDLKFRSY